MPERFQSLRGFHDQLPGRTEHWRRFETLAHALFSLYGFREIRPPHLEPTELFVRSVGELTDIVGKEMFTLKAGDESISLRPEITASVCRAYIQHGLDRRGANRLYYIGPAFRRERPQKGRLRQFHQAGVEVLGESDPEADVEVIVLGARLVERLGIEGFELRVNSLGDAACRPRYREALVAALRDRADRLCEDCRSRIERNPLRVLDCKRDSCQQLLEEVPTGLEFLCQDCERHFERVREGLEQLEVKATVDARLVRGLDYYVRTAFEIATAGLGAQNAVLGGGRYDGLIRDLGGGDVSGLGWACGIERLLLAAALTEHDNPPKLDAFVVTLGPRARERALGLVEGLRARNVATMWDTAGHGLGGQMKRAGRSGAAYAVLIGDDELARGTVTLKDLTTGEQREAPLGLDALAAELTRARGADARASDPRERPLERAGRRATGNRQTPATPPTSGKPRGSARRENDDGQ
ncbi:MAG: histidine--tRNA ligase [Acidobacteriota bacterium]|nr:MAG: histidine--tRNA ligase [Acidobacteriota bacterium]